MNTQFITNDDGKKIAAIIPIKRYKKMLEELEDMEDVALYDKAKVEDDGERITLSQYVKKRKVKKNG